MRKPTRGQIVRAMRNRQKVAFDEDAGHAADLIEQQAARIAELEKDARRMDYIEGRAHRNGQGGGWVGFYDIYGIPAWHDAPGKPKKPFHYATLREAVDAAMQSREPQ